MFRPAALIAALMLSAAPVWGQTAPDPYAPTDPAELEAWLRARGEAYHRAPDAQQDPAELERTAALNAEIAARNDKAEAVEQADAAAYAEAKSRYQAAASDYEAAASAAATAQANYEADLRASQAAQAQYERDQAEWRRRVAACEAGVRSACAPVY